MSVCLCHTEEDSYKKWRNRFILYQLAAKCEAERKKARSRRADLMLDS